MNKISKNQRKSAVDGISLLEVILAIAVFVIASASIAHFVIGAQTASDYGTSKMQAIFLAREKMEEVRETRDVSGFSALSDGITEETVVLGDRSYDTKIEISCIGEVCEVESTVSWTVRGSEESVYFIEHLTDWEYEEVVE